MSGNRILIVAAHPDDEVLGCGGTVARLKNEGKYIAIMLLGAGRGDPQDNRFDTIPLIEIVQRIENKIDEFQPDIIFTHYEHDLNVDHRITYQAVITATRPIPGQTVKEIYSFEIPSSTEWSFPLSFSPDVFWDITDTIDLKIKALNEYKSELRPFPHPRSLIGVNILSEYRGMQIGVGRAEAFKTVRVIR